MKKLLTNNIGYKLIALIFAVMLWLVVVNISDPTVTRTISGIPVTKTDESVLTSQGKVYVVLEGSTASISVKGPRSIVDELDSDDFIAEAPFSEMTNLNAVPIYVTHKYSKYEKSVEITQKTRTMVLSIENINTKYFDIDINFVGEPASGYTVGSTKLSTTFVKLSAPESILEQIETASIDVDVTKLKGNMQTESVIKYYDASGNKVDVGEYANASEKSIVVNVVIYQITEVPITVTVTGEPAEGYEYVSTELSLDKVALEGEDISQIDSIALPNDILDITDATEDVTVDIDISQYLPAGVRLVDNDNKMVTITAKIEKYVTGTYDLPIENIEMRNVPEDVEAEFADSSAKIKLVGLQENHSNISINDIFGYVDLSGATEGTKAYSVVLDLPDEISLESDVKVRITVTKEKETTTKETDKRETTSKESTTAEQQSETSTDETTSSAE